ncbi:MAG: phosphoribosyltransferase family protein [Bifidobacterium breve]
MAQSDITIDALDKVGKEDAEYLVSLVRSVPGFPKEGIIFRDFMPVLADAKGLRILLNALEAGPAGVHPASSIPSQASNPADSCLARPWPLIWAKDSSPCVKQASCRPKPLANPTTSNMARQALKSRPTAVSRQAKRVLIVDDLIATGGTAKAATDLIEKAGGTVVGFSFVMRFDGLDGLEQAWFDKPSSSLIAMPA